MINGKFFTGLPPKMIDRSGGLNRQQTNFFWPDDTQNQSAVDSRVKRRASIQAESRGAYIPSGHQSNNSDAENKERFKKEFTKSSIEFYDNVEQTPLRRTRQKLPNPPKQKFQNVEPPVDTSGKRKENFSSTIEFFDFAEDLNNVPRTDKNNKVEVERNTKNSPKLQNKHLSFEPHEEAINFIENNVRDMRITAPPRRRHTIKDTRQPRYGRQPSREDQHYSDFTEDYLPARRQPLPPPPIRNRYSESDPDFDEYTPRHLAINSRPEFYDHDPVDYIDGRPSPSARLTRQHHFEETISSRKPGRQVHFTYSDNEHNSIGAASTSQDFQQFSPRKVNILKIDNDIRNNEHRTMPIGGITLTPPLISGGGGGGGGGPSHKHLQSNICFSDTESTMTPPPAAGPPRRNIRSSAVSRVSVGLPD